VLPAQVPADSQHKVAEILEVVWKRGRFGRVKALLGRYRAPLGRRVDHRSHTQGDARGLRNHDPLGRPDPSAHAIHPVRDEAGARTAGPKARDSSEAQGIALGARSGPRVAA
jgi:hypothetical protein